MTDSSKDLLLSSALRLEKKVRELEAQLAELRGQEPVGFTHKAEISNMNATGLYLRAWPVDRRLNEGEGYTIPLYTRPVPPAASQPYTVPDEAAFEAWAKSTLDLETTFQCDVYKGVAHAAWVACRAAMLRPVKDK